MTILIVQKRTGFYYHGRFKGIPIFTPVKSAARIFGASTGEVIAVLTELNKSAPGWCELHSE